MLYSRLVAVYEKTEATTKKLEKRDILAELYKHCPQENLYQVVLLSMGLVSLDAELGIAREMMLRVISKAYGIGDEQVTKKFKETGDLGLVAEYFSKNKKQTTLLKRELTVDMVFDNLKKLPDITGSGSQDRKISLISELLGHAKPNEARYIVRTVLGEMRIGIAAGIVRDAIAKAFDKEVKEVEQVYDTIGDFGAVAELAKKGKLKAEIQVGRFVRVMLAERSPGLKEALDEFEHAALELKYDGFRMQIHKQQDKITLFSRRMENVTKQFPDIVLLAKECINARETIVEGEVLAVDEKGNPKSFQTLSRRIQRKYDIEKTVKDIPVQVNLFDMIYFNGHEMMSQALNERWKKLKSILKEKKGKFQLAEHIETKNFNEANKFYQYSLKKGQEGLMVKNLEAKYQPGKRVGYWLKVKPIMEPLDLVITGATWGEGKRAKWLSSLLLSCRDDKTGKFLATGMMGSGLTEEQLEDITKRIKPLITKEHGRDVDIKPEIVIEVAYEEIQRSPKYPTGFALRFPRLLRFREKEKRPEDVNTTRDIEELFRQQRGKKRRGK